MEKRSYPSRCINYPHIKTERESSRLWQSSRHPFIVNCWEDPCKSPTEPIRWTPWTVRASPRKPMWIQEGQRNSWHDLHSKTASREMPGTECGPVHDLCWPYQSTWHNQGLWKIMVKFGCPAEFIAIVWQFHNSMLARVQNDVEFSDPFPVTNGVEQGCVLDPTLFSMIIMPCSQMLFRMMTVVYLLGIALMGSFST